MQLAFHFQTILKENNAHKVNHSTNNESKEVAVFLNYTLTGMSRLPKHLEGIYFLKWGPAQSSWAMICIWVWGDWLGWSVAHGLKEEKALVIVEWYCFPTNWVACILKAVFPMRCILVPITVPPFSSLSLFFPGPLEFPSLGHSPMTCQAPLCFFSAHCFS